ncbi:GNAT family N-acetyltransferase [Streptomyces mangrovisoli]|uniref:GNAT family N-acetyltransferase n=1 Tax=Streptomyces mangrovisoli TaxID=1428628 RepID=A0A1J4NN62_9ACTN|nr:GNAT family protein [Streptomyces mangrovisoli]OIJ62717.1 GNAT family N-acetyltransferase [Streptomyces mangrovisoli]
MQHWPPSGITVRTPLVELRHPTPEDLDALASLGAEGVHVPGFMPFFSQWTDGDPATVARRVLQRHWNAMANWGPNDWTLYLVAVHDGEVIGSQSLGARDFVVTREVLLTSWLGLRHQGRGLGGHARAAALELAFTGLGAHDAFSVVRRGNDASQAVCRKFGFTHDGAQVNAVRGERVVSDRYRLGRDAWTTSRRTPAEITGLEPALGLFGLTGPTETPALAAPSPSAAPALAATLSGVRFAPDPDHVDA